VLKHFPGERSALENYFLNDLEKRYKIFCKDDQQFLAATENKLIPAWTLSSYHSTYFDKDLLDYVLDHFENKNINQFFSMIDLQIDRYQKYLEHVVEPAQLTDRENINHDVLQYRTSDNTRYIHLWVLKNEHRII
jgi:hypothetical protein